MARSAQLTFLTLSVNSLTVMQLLPTFRQSNSHNYYIDSNIILLRDQRLLIVG